MRVFLDDTLVQDAPPTLSGGVRAAAALAESQGRIIIEVKADGQPLSDDALSALPGSSGGVVELRLTSADTRSIVKVALLDAADLLQQHIPGHSEAARKLHAGDTSGALAGVEPVLEVWRLVRETIDKCAGVMGRTGEALAAEADPAGPDAVARLSACLSGLQGGLSRQDWAAVADVLEYDLTDQASRWVNLLRSAAALGQPVAE